MMLMKIHYVSDNTPLMVFELKMLTTKKHFSTANLRLSFWQNLDLLTGNMLEMYQAGPKQLLTFKPPVRFG